MKSSAELKEMMLTSLLAVTNIREANNVVAYYFDAIEEVEEGQLKLDIERLVQGVPVQYVAKCAFFYGFKFLIDQKVLIPRPETEELVHWIISDYKSIQEPIKILDIGTGSGCIILSILKTLKHCSGCALDIDPAAVNLVQRNAEKLNTHLDCIESDILNENIWEKLDQFDAIVCNPPYIAYSEIKRMGENVVKHEPESALFVTGEDPLLFYNSILTHGKKNLNEGGCFYFETSDLYHDEMVQLVERLSYNYEFKKDMQGKWRMLKAWLK